jgi:ABC-type dipeptide/oligopeptide/nickel transport system ATPase component
MGNDMKPLLRVRDLAVSFMKDERSRVRAVDGVSLSVYPGQTLAVVGESGSGKSITALSLLRLLPDGASIDRGSIEFASHRVTRRDADSTTKGSVNIPDLSPRDLRALRGNEIAMIFQEPMTSLNPVFTIGEQIEETIMLHRGASRSEARALCERALADVGIPDPASRQRQYPHEFSGGMRQRVMIAMALVCEPRLLLADEPTTALDATIQSQILTLLRDLQRVRGLAILLITHALGLVVKNADVVCVMYAGRVVEYARVADLFDHPLHPYTQGLLACIPSLRTPRDRLRTVRDFVADPARFERVAGTNAHAWWAAFDPPMGTRRDSEDHARTRLAEVAPGRWVLAWDTPAIDVLPPTLPDLPPAGTTARGDRPGF